ERHRFPGVFFATLWTSFDEVSVPAEGRSRQLRANDCVVQGVHATAFVDTGSDYTVSNEALFLACRKKNPHLPVIGLVSLSGVTGGAVIGKIVRFDRFSLGELLFTDTAVVVTNMEIFRLWGMSDQPALLMGMNCLRAFKWVSIDYGRKEFDFKTTRAVSRPDWLPRQTIA
ncbi:MAG: retropepsin-like aspartic protease, partial [Steroidobacteraceae bacterium]